MSMSTKPVRLAVDYPSVAEREGPAQVAALAQAIEAAGYHEIAIFDHVVMGYSAPGRADSRYPPQMPILEALALMSFLAAATDRIGLSTEVLVLPQRQPALVAKQISTIDTLSGGRVRLGVGVGWQESEYDALQEPFSTRGKRMDEAIDLLRAYFGEETVDFDSDFYPTQAMAMEPKPPQGSQLPIWIGGSSAPALRRVVAKGDGWMSGGTSNEQAAANIAALRQLAESSGRDPDDIGLQMMLQEPPRKAEDKAFYADDEAVARRAVELNELGFDWLSVNATAVFQSGARSVEAMADRLGSIHERLSAELDVAPQPGSAVA